MERRIVNHKKKEGMPWQAKGKNKDTKKEGKRRIYRFGKG